MTAMSRTQTFNYRVSSKVRGAYPGAHVGQMVGAGQLFKRHAPLIASPDPRRIDLRASLLDPFQQFNVRVYQQATQLTVFLLADLSASMSFQGDRDKRGALADGLLSVADSASQAGDLFGFIGCADAVDSDYLLLPSAHGQQRIRRVAESLRQAPLHGQAKGLLQAVRYLPARPALVFLLSDFHWPAGLITHLLQALSRHFVVPLALWDKQEYERLPAWGSIRLRDLESGRQRTLLMRPALRRKIIAAFERRRDELTRQFRAFGCEPLFLDEGFQAERLNQYFLRHSA